MGNLHRYDKERGHSLVPDESLLRQIPPLYATDGVPFGEKTIYLSYFAGGRARWLIAEIDPQEWLAFGLCDLGMGFPEWGYVSIYELAELEVFTPQGLPLYVERDLTFLPKPFSEVEE